jgi:hypothetical protein
VEPERQWQKSGPSAGAQRDPEEQGEVRFSFLSDFLLVYWNGTA